MHTLRAGELIRSDSYSCRYSLMPRIRGILGCASPPDPVELELHTPDSVVGNEYISVALTTSWIGGVSDLASIRADHAQPLKGAVLCFFHALGGKQFGAINRGPSRGLSVIATRKGRDADGSFLCADKTTEDDNEANPSPWTNWCGPLGKGATYLPSASCTALFEALSQATSLSGLPSPSPSTLSFSDLGVIADGPPAHVFQILDQKGDVLLTFPRPEGEMVAGVTAGKYDPESYAKLARAVILKPKDIVTASTSCTRRFRSKHPM